MIEVLQLTKSYGTHGNENNVLEGISLTVGDRDFAVILGASGSGKSTLLHVMSGLERPNGGSVTYDGVEITRLSDAELTRFRRENVGFIFQQYYLLPNMTVEQNVRMGAELAENRDYQEMIAAVGLADKLKSYPSALSGGEQQRVAVARALAKKPKYLFLDEPTGALDEATGRLVLDYIDQMQKCYGFAVIMVTHNQNIAEMANTVIKMNSGVVTDICKNGVPKSAYDIGW